jgi:thiamine-monophosphate kinase
VIKDTLLSLGERLITDAILYSRYGKQPDFGDDCSIIPITKSKCLVATIDPCPYPMSWILGYKDYYYFGWLLATINLSDIAAMGAKPIGILTSYILPNKTKIEEFSRLLDGIDAACRQAGTKVIGGNIKESKTISCEAVALGYCAPNRLIRRKGAKVEDSVVVIGDMGLFWSGVLKSQYKIQLATKENNKVMSNIFTPRAKIKEGQIISRYKLLSSAMDNSDGLYPSVKELAVRNSVDIHLDFSKIKWDATVLKISDLVKIDPLRLAIGWGDWQLVGTVPKDKYDQLVDKMSEINTPVYTIGKVMSGSGCVKLRYEQEFGEMSPIDSERFSKKSWFTKGIDAYISDLLNTPLIIPFLNNR